MRKMIKPAKFLVPVLLIVVTILDCQVRAEEVKKNFSLDQFSSIEVNGFFELRAGCRIQEDPYEKRKSVMESRMQAEFFTYINRVEFKYKGDVWGDKVSEHCEYNTREAWIFSRPNDLLDIKIGRQVLTWGTGDLVFLNDMFPKDWQSYFIGRDKEYLKAPSDTAKISIFTSLANIDVVYTPKFDPDRYITGKYISYYNWDLKRMAGQDAVVAVDQPDRWFYDDEVAVRVYGNIHNYELALYGYRGFWKRPEGEAMSGTAIFPELNVYGASARGQVGFGIGNIEIAYYQSADDKSGSNPRINNSEMRCLIGYTQELAKNLNAGLQYYIEYMLDYSNYKRSLASGPALDRDRHVVTLQLAKLLMSQNLELSFSAYYSHSDNDAYFRPNLRYKYSDKIVLEGGANIFLGKESYTFFGQFENNTNIYAAVRYSF